MNAVGNIRASRNFGEFLDELRNCWFSQEGLFSVDTVSQSFSLCYQRFED